MSTATRPRRGIRSGARLALGLAAIAALSGCTFIERSDVPERDAPPRGAGISFPNDLSGTGRYESFTSTARLVAGDTDDQVDIYVRDHLTDATERISVAASGGNPNGRAWASSISGDGRYVLFTSEATNLVTSGPTPAGFNLFLRDRMIHSTRLVDVTSDAAAPNAPVTDIDLSANGQAALFDSTASNILPGSSTGRRDVFVHDLGTGATERVSVSNTGDPADNFMTAGGISGDGSRVVFSGSAQNLVAGTTTSHIDRVYLRDRSTGTTSLVSVGRDGGANESGSVFVEALSTNGRYVLFQSSSQNLTDDGRGDSLAALFVRDLTTGTTTRVKATSGEPHPLGIIGTGISDDGRYVLARGLRTGLADVHAYVFDRVRQVLRIVGTTPAQIPLSGSGAGAISADGAYVTFGTLDPSSPSGSDRQAVFLRSTVVPTLTAAAPSTAARGSTVDVTLTGTYLFADPFVSFGDGTAVTNVTVLDEQHVRVTVQIASDAATGKRTALLQNQGTGAGPRSGGLTVLVDALDVT
jgi:Tol biopolymer transport system component